MLHQGESYSLWEQNGTDIFTEGLCLDSVHTKQETEQIS